MAGFEVIVYRESMIRTESMNAVFPPLLASEIKPLIQLFKRVHPSLRVSEYASNTLGTTLMIPLLKCDITNSGS